MQDSHRQKNWASEQNQADTKDAGSRQMERLSPEQPDPDGAAQVQPGNRDRERPYAKAAAGVPPDSVLERGRLLQQDAQALTTSVRESFDLLHRYVSEQVEQRPYTTVGIAAGLGYVLGGGLANRISGTALGTLYRIGLALAARELSAHVPMAGLSEDSPREERPVQ